MKDEKDLLPFYCWQVVGPSLGSVWPVRCDDREYPHQGERQAGPSHCASDFSLKCHTQTLSDPGGRRHSHVETLRHGQHRAACGPGTSHHPHTLLWSQSGLLFTEVLSYPLLSSWYLFSVQKVEEKSWVWQLCGGGCLLSVFAGETSVLSSSPGYLSWNIIEIVVHLGCYIPSMIWCDKYLQLPRDIFPFVMVKYVDCGLWCDYLSHSYSY